MKGWKGAKTSFHPFTSSPPHPFTISIRNPQSTNGRVTERAQVAQSVHPLIIEVL